MKWIKHESADGVFAVRAEMDRSIIRDLLVKSGKEPGAVEFIMQDFYQNPEMVYVPTPLERVPYDEKLHSNAINNNQP